MKKLLLLFFIVALTVYSKAQSWCTTGSTWHYAFAYPGNGYTKYTYLLDTLVGSQTCNKIRVESHGFGAGNFPIDHTNYIYTYEQNGIVFKNNGSLSAPHYDTLYNFTGPVGTKWRSNPTSGQACTQSYIEITGIGTIVIQGQTLNYRTVFYENYFYYAPQMTPAQTGIDTLFERIGTRHHMEFITGYNCADITDAGPSPFRCFSDYQISNQMSALACNYVTGIQNKDANALKLEMNNPASDIVHIKIQGTISSNQRLVLTDQFGKVVLDRSVNENEFDIDTRYFSGGTYILQFQTGNDIATRKLLILK